MNRGPARENDASRPARPVPDPDLPEYVVDPIERQSPERLEVIASYASELAAWKRARRDQEATERRSREEVSEDERAALQERGVSTDPANHEGVPSNAYITIKETKPGYHYYYFQWREGPDSWGNKYIAPVASSDQ